MIKNAKPLWFVTSLLGAAIVALAVLNLTVPVRSERKDLRPTMAPSLKATEMASFEQREQQRMATQGHQTTVPVTPVLPYDTPVPAGSKPVWAETVASVAKSEVAGYQPFRQATSIWRNGGVVDTDARGQSQWYELFIYTLPGEGDRPVVITHLPAAPQHVAHQYEKDWVCPRTLGTLTITAITGGATGSLSFTSSSGQTGSLNMATGVWTFTP